MVQQRSIGLPPGTPYETVVAAELPEIPDRFNIGAACADEQPAGRPALVTFEGDGERRLTFGDLTNRSARLAAGLRALGVMRGDRVAIVLPQRWETVVALLAVCRIGAIAVPLDPEYGPEALGHRLGDCNPRVAIVDDDTRSNVADAVDTELIHIRHGRGSVEGLIAFHQPVPPADTMASDPALLFYEGRPDGPPAGILLAHRALLGWLPSIELALGGFPNESDVVWTPAPWSEPASILGTILPALHGGATVVGSSSTASDPSDDLELIRSNLVTCVVAPNDDLRLLAASGLDFGGLTIRTVLGVGPAGTSVREWAAAAGWAIDELLAPTHVGPAIGTASQFWPHRPGTLGRPFPGFDVAVLDSDDRPLATGRTGRLAVRADHPAAMLELWRRPDTTTAATTGDWLLTDRTVVRDPDGAIRAADHEDRGVIAQGARTIGPWEIERCLEADPDVERVAVVASPDPTSGEVVKAYVVTSDRSAATPETAIRLATRCGERLAPHLAPKRISFVAALPMSDDGTIDRGLLTGT